ncbi:flagellar FlbD family protein [Geomonas sp. RF6]|uniref:flagellar FlbD family protein n=1 Tax=Geomonas sp. RF6 TaxID=2897342 RepID=UPI001E4AF84D|nr:flagellar FlbD family protein [Geomonas sp. RF6]UFS72411.1 flagellar FlbD family protein [Geomonas sp. RF6]
MIRVTTLDGTEIFLNPDHIEIISETPDTLITLVNGKRYLIVEPARVVIGRIISFRGRILQAGRPKSGPKYLARSGAKDYRPQGGT